MSPTRIALCSPSSPYDKTTVPANYIPCDNPEHILASKEEYTLDSALAMVLVTAILLIHRR